MKKVIYYCSTPHHAPVHEGHPCGVDADRDVGTVGHVVGTAGSVGLAEGVGGRVVPRHVHHCRAAVAVSVAVSVGGGDWVINI